MISYDEFISKLDGLVGKLDASLLGEAGNVSSAIALRKHSNVLKNGRRGLSNRNSSDVEKLLAKMIADCAGLCMLSIAVSGGSSALSSVAKGASVRSL